MHRIVELQTHLGTAGFLGIAEPTQHAERIVLVNISECNVILIENCMDDIIENKAAHQTVYLISHILIQKNYHYLLPLPQGCL